MGGKEIKLTRLCGRPSVSRRCATWSLLGYSQPGGECGRSCDTPQLRLLSLFFLASLAHSRSLETHRRSLFLLLHPLTRLTSPLLLVSSSSSPIQPVIRDLAKPVASTSPLPLPPHAAPTPAQLKYMRKDRKPVRVLNLT